MKRRLLAAEIALIYLFLYAPVLILAIFSFNRSRAMAHWEGFTISWYAELWRNHAIRAALANSMEAALWTTLISAALGTPAALALERHRFRWKGGLEQLIYLPIIIPEIVMAVSLAMFFGLAGATFGMATIVAAHVAFSISYMILVVRARLAGMGGSLEEAAMDLGASEFVAFFRVTLPNIMPAVFSGALLTFTVSFDDFVITSFVAGVGSSTLPLYVYSTIKQGVTPEVNAVSTIMLVLTILLAYFAHRLGGATHVGKV